VSGPTDYVGIPPKASLYQSCCAKSSTVCGIPPDYKKGCATVLADFVNDNLVIVGGVGIGVAIVEVSSKPTTMSSYALMYLANYIPWV